MKHHVIQRVRATGALSAIYAVMILTALAADATGTSPVLVNLVTYLVLGAFVLLVRRTRWFIEKWNDQKPPETPGDDLRPIGSYGFIACTAIALVTLLATTLYASGQHRGSNVEHMSNGDKIAVILLAPLVGPIVEELVMRGLIYPVLRRGWGIPASMLISALTFAAIHADAIASVYAFFLGLILAFVYETSRRLKDVMIIHVVFNTVGLFVASVDTSTWLGAGLSHTLAIIIWILTLVGLHEHVTMRNDTLDGRRGSRTRRDDDTRSRPAQGDGSNEEGQSA